MRKKQLEKIENRLDETEFELRELRQKNYYRLKDIEELQKGSLRIAESLGALTDYLGLERYEIDKPAIKRIGYRKKSNKKK